MGGGGISESDWIGLRLLTWVTKLPNELEDRTKMVALGAVPDKGERDLLMRWTCSTERGREA